MSRNKAQMQLVDNHKATKTINHTTNKLKPILQTVQSHIQDYVHATKEKSLAFSNASIAKKSNINSNQRNSGKINSIYQNPNNQITQQSPINNKIRNKSKDQSTSKPVKSKRNLVLSLNSNHSKDHPSNQNSIDKISTQAGGAILLLNVPVKNQLLTPSLGSQNRSNINEGMEKAIKSQRASLQPKRGRNQPSQQHQPNGPQSNHQNIHEEQKELFQISKIKQTKQQQTVYQQKYIRDDSSLSFNSQSDQQEQIGNSKPFSPIEQLQFGQSSIRQMIKQKSVKDLKIALISCDPQKNQAFIPRISELEESISKIDESQFSKQNREAFKNSLSFINSNASQIMKDDQKQLIHSKSTKKIDRKETSCQYDSPSEKTIMDVLNLCSSTTNKYNSGNNKESFKFQQLQDRQVSEFKERIFIEDEDENIQLVIQNQQYEINNDRLGPGFGDSTSNQQIIFNYGNNSDIASVSSNVVVNHFLEEKKKELEALEEMDRESDTTEQLTYCGQISRPESQVSQFDPLIFEQQRQTARIFEYYNQAGNNEKEQTSKKRKKKRVEEQESAQKKSNLQMVSIRDLLDSQNHDLYATPDDINKIQIFDASIGSSSNQQISQPKFRMNSNPRQQSQDQRPNLLQSNSTNYLFQSHKNKQISNHPNFFISDEHYSDHPNAPMIINKSHSKASLQVNSDYRMFAHKKTRNLNISSIDNQDEYSVDGVEGVRYTTLQSCRTTKNLIIDRTKNYFLKDYNSPDKKQEKGGEIQISRIEKINQSPEDLSSTDIDQQILAIHRKAATIKTFNYRPSKKGL